MNNINWNDIESVIGSASISTQTHFITKFHHAWPTMSRNFKWKQSETNICPLCQKHEETTNHVYQCSDERAKPCRSLQILEIKKKLQASSTDPFIINHMGKILYQFSAGYNVNLLPTPATASPELKLKVQSLNNQVSMGPLLMLSGFITCDLSANQSTYMETLQRQKKPNMSSWNRTIIKSLLEYSQAIWKFRSEILHDEAVLTQDAMLRTQATQLLYSIRRTLHRIPSKNRNLLK